MEALEEVEVEVHDGLKLVALDEVEVMDLSEVEAGVMLLLHWWSSIFSGR